MLSLLFYRLQQFVDGQALGWCLLLALVALLGSTLLLLLRAVRRTSTLVPVAWTLGSAALLVVLAGLRIADARQLTLEVLLRRRSFGDPSEDARVIALSLSRIFITQSVVFPAIALAMLAMLVFLWRATRVPQRRLLALAASLLLLTALGLCAGNERVDSGSYCADSAHLSACRFERATQSLQPFHQAALGLVVAAAVGGSLALSSAVRSARAQSDGSKRASSASTLLLLVGIAAFWTTRAEHADVANLIPPDPDYVVDTWISRRLQDQLPAQRPGCHAFGGPIIELTPDGVFVDATLVDTPEALRALLVKKRELWEQINPHNEFIGLVLLAAPRTSRVGEVVPWLPAAKAAGYPKVGVLQKVPTITLQTRTVGLLEKRRACVEVWPVERVVESALTRFDTWGDLVASF